jgi:hypothetical protein
MIGIGRETIEGTPRNKSEQVGKGSETAPSSGWIDVAETAPRNTEHASATQPTPSRPGLGVRWLPLGVFDAGGRPWASRGRDQTPNTGCHRSLPWRVSGRQTRGTCTAAGEWTKEFIMTDLWSYRLEIETMDIDLEGFDVEATDGHVGKVDDWSAAAGDSYLVVDTGFWIFGKKRVVPARAVRQIDVEGQKVFVDMTKDQIKGAPDHHDDWAHPDRREPFTGYYGTMPW